MLRTRTAYMYRIISCPVIAAHPAASPSHRPCTRTDMTVQQSCLPAAAAAALSLAQVAALYCTTITSLHFNLRYFPLLHISASPHPIFILILLLVLLVLLQSSSHSPLSTYLQIKTIKLSISKTKYSTLNGNSTE